MLTLLTPREAELKKLKQLTYSEKDLIEFLNQHYMVSSDIMEINEDCLGRNLSIWNDGILRIMIGLPANAYEDKAGNVEFISLITKHTPPTDINVPLVTSMDEITHLMRKD